MSRKRCKRKSKFDTTSDAGLKRNKSCDLSVKCVSPSLVLETNEVEIGVDVRSLRSGSEYGRVALPIPSKNFIVLSQTRECLIAAEMAIKRGDAVVVSGVVGCGKTMFVEYLSRVFHSNLKIVQISEQADSKTLVGGYTCTDVPGQFIWRPGPLYTALVQGHWLLLEDIDRGSADVAVLLTSIIEGLPCAAIAHQETKLMDPISGEPVKMNPSFRLLMTKRLVSGPSGDLRMEYDNPFSDILDRKTCLITLPPMDCDAVHTLLSKCYSSMSRLIDKIMKIYTVVQQWTFLSTNDTLSAFSGRNRLISLRDLLRFCSRIQRLSNDESQVVFLDAVDCFVAHMSDTSMRFNLSCQIAGELNMTTEKVAYCLNRRPVGVQVDLDEGLVHLGRASLSCQRTLDWESGLSSSSVNRTLDTTWPFASTRLACTLLERIAVAVAHHEPVLLVGETGTGKTTAVQRLAQLCGRQLHVINLNQQSDSVDLMGGFKPVDTRALIRPLREQFESLFCHTFRTDTNLSFLGHINTYFNDNRWRDLLLLMRHPTQLAIAKLRKAPTTRGAADDSVCSASNLHGWTALLQQLDQVQLRLDASVKANQPALGFAFIEGALVRAIQNGDWVLLDEVNLAAPEMLNCLSGLLDSGVGSVTLIERGDKEPLPRNSNFHLFAAMNPSTDVGKRELPVGLRNRFTEIYVPELNPGVVTDADDRTLRIDSKSSNAIRSEVESSDREDLCILTRSYLVALSPSPVQVTTVVRLYAALRQAAVEGLVDGVGQRPHFSLRTLCRALVEAGRGYHGSTVRSLYEGLFFSFGSQIGRASRPILDTLIRRYLALAMDRSAGQSRALDQLLASPIPAPPAPGSGGPQLGGSSTHVNVEGYWIPRGPEEPRVPEIGSLCDGSYILTSTVRDNLRDLARVVAAGGSLPVLLQGETSVGKTSLITYLAGRVGQICYRINNHEHTDQQTYMGTYTVASATAQANPSQSHSELINPPPLVFQEGPLVQAMRAGYWIILDELNLAPTEILEALNRVLDDNRTLFIPETQETIKAHPHFRLFATQNPPGLYAGRKLLSRALRNRFVELHFDPLPRNELEVILEKRCALPASRAHRLVEVLHRLQLARCNSNLFHGKDSFITLRDLFRWAERYRLATCDRVVNSDSVFFDWDAYLADQGYLLLAGRVRNSEEARIVADAIEAVFKRPISESRLFDLTSDGSPASLEFLEPVLGSLSTRVPVPLPAGFEHIVWTRDMRRLLVLVGNALKYQEPVLLVGETGCGKTTVCQLFASLKAQRLHCVNCHQYTEAADFLGALRPVRYAGDDCNRASGDNRLFEWVDGPLVTAMSNGEMFLLDEISLADDAVLERLNSLLEPERRIHLTERSELTDTRNTLAGNDLVAHPKFRFVATMNPGGDYGKKELSPALRNRFTEIWCMAPTLTSPAEQTQFRLSDILSDLIAIVRHNLLIDVLPRTKDVPSSVLDQLATVMVEFVRWYALEQVRSQSSSIGLANRRPPPTIRDLIAWVGFMKSVLPVPDDHCSIDLDAPKLNVFSACLHGAALVFLDALESSTDEVEDQPNIVSQAIAHLADRLQALIPPGSEHMMASLNCAARYTQLLDECTPDSKSLFSRTHEGRMQFGVHPFFIDLGSNWLAETSPTIAFSFDTPTSSVNLRRLLRALQLPQRALLLEGSPGVGKTTLVLALAQATGHPVVRINLSEATEASDLLGGDLPVEGAGPGIFAWRDGPLLQALRQGHWIILDEMNLASQSVLECLNACLDHRGEIYVPELGAKFTIEPRSTRIFACQNPVREGGGRKGLPKSFLNRFTQVYLQPLSVHDQQFILSRLFPTLDAQVIRVMIQFNAEINRRVNVGHEFATQGGPWEFNLRDLVRWCELLTKHKIQPINPGLYVHLLYADRMRTVCDKQKVAQLWNHVCSSSGANHMVYYQPVGHVQLVDRTLLCGLATNTNRLVVPDASRSSQDLILLDALRGSMESLLTVLEAGWMAILVGPAGCGKRFLAHVCATLMGRHLSTVCLSPNSDTVELLGSLEQHENGGVFVWVDSPLVTGIRQGHWVIIENANLCSPSVLDRLNSLLEPGGELIINERGLDIDGQLVRLKPHPQFRLILTVDEAVSHTGSYVSGVSRAMRNRGVEIAFCKELSTTEPDLIRILNASGAPLSIARAITAFHRELRSLCDPNQLARSSNAPVGLRRLPPIGSLISAAIYAQQLLTETDKLTDDSTTEGVVRELFPDGQESQDIAQLIPSVQNHSLWFAALARSLNWLYAGSQVNGDAIKFVKSAIREFLNSPLSAKFASLQATDIVPSNYHTVLPLLTQQLEDVFACSDAGQYRRRYVHCLVMSYVAQPRNDELVAARTLRSSCRILLEQANPVPDLSTWLAEIPSGCDDDLRVAGANLLHESTQFQQNTEFAIPDWLDWPDQRWIPGWWWYYRPSSNTQELDWDRKLRLLSANELLCQSHAYGSAELSSQEVVSDKVILSELPILSASRMLFRGDLPATWAELYPGLREVTSHWLRGMHSFITLDFVSDTGHARCDLSAVDRALYAVHHAGLLWSWLTLFGLRTVGPAEDWPERLEFHQTRAGLGECGHGNRTPPLSTLRIVIISDRLATPCFPPIEQLDFSVLTPNWSHYGRKITDVLSCLQLETDYFDDEEMEPDLLNAEENNVTDSSIPSENLICLWPLVMLTSVRSHKIQTNLSTRSASRFLLTMLTRPSLLTFLSSIQSCTRPVPAQQRAFRSSSVQTPDDQAIAEFCAQVDLPATQRVLPPTRSSTLDLTSIAGEWRSLSHAVHALTWPMLSHYGLDARQDRQTLIGWYDRQNALRKAYQLLLMFPFSSPATGSSSINGKDVREQSGELLHAVHASIQLILDTQKQRQSNPDTFTATSMSPVSASSAAPTKVDATWIAHEFSPHLTLARHTLSKWPEWESVLHLAECLAHYVTLLHTDTQNVQLQAISGVVFGCLYLRCVSPYSPMDPYLVHELEEEAVSNELDRIGCELEIRDRMRALWLGPVELRDDDAEDLCEGDRLRYVAETGLEHPWYAAVSIYRSRLMDKARSLAKRTALGRGNRVIHERGKSNQEYAQLRRRLLAFVCGFADQFLLPGDDTTNVSSVLSHLSLCNIQRWIEVVADLVEWLTQPERTSSFADVINPFLVGLLHIHHGLQKLTHLTLSTGSLELEMTQTALELLTTGLLGGRSTVQRKIAYACSSVPLWLAVQFTQPELRAAIHHLEDSVSGACVVDSVTTRETVTAQTEFRLMSWILDLVWLHLIECRSAPPKVSTETVERFVGRLLAFVTRPLARRWRLVEAERKRAAAERASLFIEAASRKQRVCDQLQHFSLPGKRSRRSDTTDTMDDLIDPDVSEQVDWRLRFPETASLAAVAELNAHGIMFGGFDKTRQIQQAVQNIEAVDTWLRQSLERTTHTWIPENNELAYFVQRLIGLLLARRNWCRTHRTSLVQSISEQSREWRWHSLLGGYSLASSLLFKSGLSLDPSIDHIGLPVHLCVSAHLTQTDVRSRQPIPLESPLDSAYSWTPKPRVFDVYRDPIPVEACGQLRAVLSHLETRVRQLLHAWPGQPSLVRLLVLSQRIKGFQVSDPLMKFITGLEMIWEEIHEWEKNAAQHVSLMNHSKIVCDLLIEWRKVELKCWLATLDSAESAMTDHALGIWFLLHDLFLRPVTKPSKPPSAADVDEPGQVTARCRALIELMENGPLGEFDTRWRLLVALYSALPVWPGLSKQDLNEAERLVGNVTWFYAQFIPFVREELVRLRQPIEKELKGVVSVTKWGDYTRFWSVKTSVERCKRTIHKQVKAWETILRRPVRPLFESAVRITAPIMPLDLADYRTHFNPTELRSSGHIPPSVLRWLITLCQQQHSTLPTHVKRLPTLISRFRGHVARIASNAPVLNWAQRLARGTQTWLSLVADLQSATRHLESTCPPAHVLNQLRAQKCGQSAGRHAVDPEVLESARLWHQKYTALQQRKRLALAQWLNLASKGRGHGLTDSPNLDSSNDSSNTDLDSEIDMHADELSVKNQDEENTNQLPQLGLSYRRGQLHSQTGSMTVYLGQFAGSPWNHTYNCGDDVEKQYIGHEDSRDWIRQTAKRVCGRTARLLALRASLPRIPGQPDASPETVASIVTDLGGPENLARLIGFADDLVNQTSTALAACSELTSTVREFRDQTQFSLSLSPFGQDVSNQEFRACAQTALRRAQKSAFVLIQLTQDVLLQLTMFWTTCANQHCTDWPPVSQLEHVTGAELWKSVYSPLLDQYPLEPIGLLAERMRNSCEALNTLANSVLVRAMAIIQTGSLLIPPGWTCLQNDLVEATLHFVQHLRNSVTLCEQAGFYCEMNETVNTICVRLCDEVERLKTSCESSTVAIDADWADSSPVDEAFVSLSNALIRAILSTMEVLYNADRPTPSETTQVDYLLQFTRAATDTKRLVQTQLSRLFVRWNTSFQPEMANGSEVDNKLSVRLRLARCILPFLDQLNHCVQIRAAQFWHWLDNWTCLGEAMLRITGQLLTDGFCRPAGLTQSEGSGEDGDAGGSGGGGGTDNQSSSSTLPDGSQTGATSLTAQGVDTHGARDVSDQIESEEQIEGLMHDHDLEQPPDESDDEDRGNNQNQGIEMPNDNFAGRLEDAATESDPDDQGEKTKEQLENRMHDGNDLSGGADELSKEMWASEDEEEIDGKDQIDQDKTLLADETGGVEDKANRTDGSKSKLIDDQQVQQKPKEHPESEEENLTNEVCEPEDKKPNDTKRSKPMKQAEGKDRQTVAGTDANVDEETPNALNDNQLEPTDPEGDKKDEQLRAEAEMMHMDEQQETSDPDDAELSDLSRNAMDVDDPEQVDEESEVGNRELDAKGNEDEADEMINPNGSEDTTGLNSDTVEEEQEAGQTESAGLEVFPYQPGAGDLQTNTNAQCADQKEHTENSDMIDASEPPPDSATAPSAGDSLSRGPQPISSGMDGGPDNEIAAPIQQTPGAPSASQRSRPKQVPHGPRPTSDNRRQESTGRQLPIQQANVLESGTDNHELSSDLAQSDMYQHLPDHRPDDASDENRESQPHAYDSATAEQRNQNQTEASNTEEESMEPGKENDGEENMELGHESEQQEGETDRVHSEPINESQPQIRPLCNPHGPELPGSEIPVKTDPTTEPILTLGAQRPPDSVICTKPDALIPTSSTSELVNLDVVSVERDTASLTAEISQEGLLEWVSCTQRSAGLARQLCEALRLVLEPTKASRLRGDYRTGKRINMRKIIPYLASQFRKDKIWLRRSQPSQREYRILMAVDDSSSMSDNLCRQMTFDALATVVTALNLLEVGRIGVCSFGETVRILHDLNETWVGDAGPNVLARFTFKQSRTSLVQLLHSSVKLMQSSINPVSSSSLPSQLLLILSDGVFSEDPQDPAVQAAVRLARDSRLFPVCLILDDMRKKHSVFDLRRYTNTGKIVPYMDTFPLPFYLVLRDVTALPQLLADALRQWFELESTMS